MGTALLPLHIRLHANAVASNRLDNVVPVLIDREIRARSECVLHSEGPRYLAVRNVRHAMASPHPLARNALYGIASAMPSITLVIARKALPSLALQRFASAGERRDLRASSSNQARNACASGRCAAVREDTSQ